MGIVEPALIECPKCALAQTAESCLSHLHNSHNNNYKHVACIYNFFNTLSKHSRSQGSCCCLNITGFTTACTALLE